MTEKRRTNQVETTAWPTSKCQRILRPLKLKITALERALSTSHCVADGIAPWTAHTRQPRPRFGSDVSDDSTYRQCSTKLRKYGATRKQATTSKPVKLREDVKLGHNDILTSLRASVSPSLGSAYLGVYHAFRTVLEKLDSVSKFPSLAVRSASAVGMCIHLTSHQFTEDVIDADDWYEAVPSHYRSATVLGHAVQIIASSSSILGPLMPVMVLLMKDDPVVFHLLYALFESTDLTACRRTEVQALQDLATQVGTPWALQDYYTKNLTLRHILHTGFSIVAQTKSETQFDDHMENLYHQAGLVMIESGCDPEATGLMDMITTMTTRTIKCASLHFLRKCTILYSGTRQIYYTYLALIYSLSALMRAPSDPELVETSRKLAVNLRSMTVQDRAEGVDLLLKVFEPESLVELVEILVGRLDDLALILSNACSSKFEGDFVDWTNDIERDIVQGRSLEGSDKYRFEPLLGSWVVKTPGLKRMALFNIIIDNSSGEETEIDDLSTHEEDYYADCSRAQLSSAELWCEEGEDDLTSDRANERKVNTMMLNLLSASTKKSTKKDTSDILRSAQLLRSISKTSRSKPIDGSPLIQHSKTRSHRIILSSPLVTRKSKRTRRIDEDDSSGSSDAEQPQPIHTKRNRLGTRITETSLELAFKESINAPRSCSLPLRELSNLRNTFASKGTSKRQAKSRTSQSSNVRAGGDLLDTDADESSVAVLSDADELSLL